MSNVPKTGFGASFFVPLSDEQFILLGKIAATFSQVETIIDGMIMTMSGVHHAGIYETLVDGKQFAAKLTVLKSLAKLTQSGGVLTAMDAMCSALQTVATERNHAIHGQWGYLQPAPFFAAPAPGAGVPAAHSPKRSDKPLLASDLAAVLKRVEKAAAATFEAWRVFSGQTGLVPPVTFEFAAHPPMKLPPKSA